MACVHGGQRGWFGRYTESDGLIVVAVFIVGWSTIVMELWACLMGAVSANPFVLPVEGTRICEFGVTESGVYAQENERKWKHITIN